MTLVIRGLLGVVEEVERLKANNIRRLGGEAGLRLSKARRAHLQSEIGAYNAVISGLAGAVLLTEEEFDERFGDTPEQREARELAAGRALTEIAADMIRGGLIQEIVVQRRRPPVSDHAFEGDGSDDPIYCSCGRTISEHLRHPV